MYMCSLCPVSCICSILFTSSYNPDFESDPFGEEGSLWSFNYFFYNKKMKRILFLSCHAHRYKSEHPFRHICTYSWRHYIWGKSFKVVQVSIVCWDAPLEACTSHKLGALGESRGGFPVVNLVHMKAYGT